VGPDDHRAPVRSRQLFRIRSPDERTDAQFCIDEIFQPKHAELSLWLRTKLLETSMKKWISALAIAASALPLSAATAADAYPDHAITWIVPFSAGGPTDAMARNIANRLSQEIKQSIVIENAPGAGGTIGATKAARARPDGYTFLVGHIGYMAAAPSLYTSLHYDPVKDFDAVFRFPDTPLVLLVGENSPYKTIDELVAYGKANPGQLDFSNAGVGSTSHLVAAMFASKANMQIQPIAYKGA